MAAIEPQVEDPFGGVIGHRHVIDLLTSEIVSPTQSYLFAGPAAVGKANVARRFAAALLSEGDQKTFARVVAGAHPDLVLVEPDGRTAITVDQARHAVSQASLTPLESDRKVFLFEEAGMMNDEAANALLKTLEEPAASTMFILVVESEDDLPDTIASRCRTVVFGRVGEDEVAAGLVANGIDEEQAARVALISGGRPGLAIALATRPEVAEFRHVWLSVPMRLPEHPGDAFRLADEVEAATRPLLAAMADRQKAELATLEAEGGVTQAVKDRHERETKRATSALYVTGLEILAGFYRDAAAAQFGAPVRNPDIPVQALTRQLPPRAMANAERVLDTIEALQANQRPQLAFASLFADLGSGN